MKNLTSEQRRAATFAYREIHQTRLYRSEQRPDGTYTLRAENDAGVEVGRATLHHDVITIESFDASASPFFTTFSHFKACIVVTLNAYAYANLPLADAFVLESDPTRCKTSLPIVTA